MNHYQQLTQEERYMIYRLLKHGFSLRQIGIHLGRSASTVSREICRNIGKRGYRYKQANSFSLYRRHVSHRNNRISAKTWDLVDSYLNLDWSPEQVANYLRLEFSIAVSAESIYRRIWTDKQSGGDLYTHLRQCRKKRRKRYGSGYNYRGHIKNRVSIDERPGVVDTKERFGDWEIDTIIGKGHKRALVSLVERKSCYSLIAKVERRDAHLVNKQTLKLLKPFKEHVHTITSDNGKEFSAHEQLAACLQTSFYFAHPYSSWERGLNENTNGLIRQYVPKGSSMEHVDVKKLNLIMQRLNTRPRKSLGYKTPQDIFFSGIGFCSPHGVSKGMTKKKIKNICTVALTN